MILEFYLIPRMANLKVITNSIRLLNHRHTPCVLFFCVHILKLLNNYSALPLVDNSMIFKVNI